MCADYIRDAGLPELHREVVRHEFAAAGIFQKFLPERRARIERAEDIAAGEVEEPRIEPRIFPCVPLPLPGAPKISRCGISS